MICIKIFNVARELNRQGTAALLNDKRIQDA